MFFCFPRTVRMKSWLSGMPEQIPADSMQGFHPKLIFPLCLPQWIFSYPTFLKGYSGGLKILFTIRAVHLFMPNMTSFNGVCSSSFHPAAPLCTDRLWAKLAISLCLGRASMCPPVTCRETLRCWSPIVREAPLLIRVQAHKPPCQGAVGTGGSVGPVALAAPQGSRAGSDSQGTSRDSPSQPGVGSRGHWGSPEHRTPPWGQGRAQAGPRHGPMDGPSSSGPMADQKGWGELETGPAAAPAGQGLTWSLGWGETCHRSWQSHNKDRTGGTFNRTGPVEEEDWAGGGDWRQLWRL